jgi:serine/threonine-protein kinase
MSKSYTVKEIKDIFPEFDISGHIGSGGFKDVFKATLDGEDVVIKLFPVEGRQMRRRAQREVRAMEAVESPVFVDLIEHFVDEIDDIPTYVIVEEYIPGETLREKISNENTDLNMAIEIADAILHCLKEFEEHELVHRDIKPSNIMVTPDGDIVLLDVGIVRFQSEESLTPDHADRGPSTPPYAAPEVLENNKDAQDVRTDMFSLGIVFYETAVGKHPFNIEGKSKPKAIQAGARKEELVPSIDDDELGDAVSMFYKGLTEHEQYDRYRKCEFAIEELGLINEVKSDV